MIQNGIIINGTVYELVQSGSKDLSHECENCDLLDQCFKMESDLLCNILYEVSQGKHFKKVDV